MTVTPKKVAQTNSAISTTITVIKISSSLNRGETVLESVMDVVVIGTSGVIGAHSINGEELFTLSHRGGSSLPVFGGLDRVSVQKENIGCIVIKIANSIIASSNCHV